MIIVRDKCIDHDLINLINDTILDVRFPWYMPTSGFTTVSTDYDRSLINDNDRVFDSPQVVHDLFIGGEVRSSLFHLFKLLVDTSLVNILGQKAADKIVVFRMKVNLLTRHFVSRELYNPPHRDPLFVEKPDYHTFSMILYLNHSDGPTRFFDGKRNPSIIKEVTPKQGRVVLFDQKYFHASSPPVDTTARIVLNVNMASPVPLMELYKYNEEEET